jgi:hypothetical protein
MMMMMMMMVVVMIVIRHEGDEADKHSDEEDRDIRGDLENIAQNIYQLQVMASWLEGCCW